MPPHKLQRNARPSQVNPMPAPQTSSCNARDYSAAGCSERLSALCQRRMFTTCKPKIGFEISIYKLNIGTRTTTCKPDIATCKPNTEPEITARKLVTCRKISSRNLRSKLPPFAPHCHPHHAVILNTPKSVAALKTKNDFASIERFSF